MPHKKRKGILSVPKESYPEPHELEAVATLISYGYDISFITPTRIKDLQAQKEIQISMSKTRSIQRVIVINKNSEIIDIP